MIIKVSKDYTKLKINNDVYALSSIENATFKVSHYASVDVPIKEEESYNFLKGHVMAEWLDNPIGYLGGKETKTVYQRKTLKCVELILHFKDKSKKCYTTGIFVSTDDHVELCIEETKINCKKILSSIKKNIKNHIVLEEGTYTIGKNIKLNNGIYILEYVEGSGIARIYNDESKSTLDFCRYLDNSERKIYYNLKLKQDMFIQIEPSLKVKLIYENDLEQTLKNSSKISLFKRK